MSFVDPACSTTSRLRIPSWLRRPLPTSPAFGETRRVVEDLRLHTVCQSANCPNHWECWSQGTATFMIAGTRCTRACPFCAVDTAKPLPLDPDEPGRVAEAARRLHLTHVVLTAVARDDLPDGGANHFRRTIEAVRAMSPEVVLEVLVPDFQGKDEAIETVLAARPHVYNHNLETVRRLTPTVRSRATYDGSLTVLRKVKERRPHGMYTKSGLMLGLGETEEELLQALHDLRRVGCDSLTLGQYLQPTRRHLPVAFYVTPETFAAYGERARAMGFSQVASGPMVRSSYHARDFYPAQTELGRSTSHSLTAGSAVPVSGPSPAG